MVNFEYREFPPTPTLTKMYLDFKDAKVWYTEYLGMTEEQYEYKLSHFYYKNVLMCPVCGHPLRSSKHLAKHGLDKAQFVAIYGGTTPEEIVARRMFDMYSPNQGKWAIQQGDHYSTVTTEGRKALNANGFHFKQWLDWGELKSHIQGKQTISIYPWGSKAQWLCLDIDTGCESYGDMTAIVSHVRGLGINDILVSFSGSKGYHVEIFIEYPLTYRQIKALGERLVQPCWEKYKSGKIEIRPTATMGIKLPLGINRKSEQRCNILDKDLQLYTYEYQEWIHFLEIQRVPMETIQSILDRPIATAQPIVAILPIVPTIETIGVQAIQVESVYTQGLTKAGTRHMWAFQIALWGRDIQHWTREEAENALEEWTHRSLRFIGNETEAMADIQSILGSVYDLGKYRLSNELKWTQAEIDLVQRVQREGSMQGARSNAPGQVLYTLISLAKYYRSNPMYVPIRASRLVAYKHDPFRKRVIFCIVVF